MADIQFISGSGKPRILVVHAVAAAIGDGGHTYTSTQVFSNNIGVNYQVRLGMRVHSFRVIAGQPNRKVWGKVVAIDSGSLTVDAWQGGTPTDFQGCFRDGWVIDLPYCEELLETFTPNQLLHELAWYRREALFFGYSYKARLDYKQFIDANTLLSLRPALNKREDDALILVPRIDRPGRQYNVLFDDAVQLSRHVERGHKNVVLTFAGTESVAFPIPQSGYGYGYAMNYGHQL